jgi:hypothetical protein
MDERTGSHAHDETDTGSSPAPTTAATLAAMRRKLAEEEHRLVDEGREFVEKARERLVDDIRKLAS